MHAVMERSANIRQLMVDELAMATTNQSQVATAVCVMFV